MVIELEEENCLLVLSEGLTAAIAAVAKTAPCVFFNPATGEISHRGEILGRISFARVPGFRKIRYVPGEARDVTVLALPEEREALLAEYRKVLRAKIAQYSAEIERLKKLLCAE